MKRRKELETSVHKTIMALLAAFSAQFRGPGWDLLIRELRSHMPGASKKKKKTKIIMVLNIVWTWELKYVHTDACVPSPSHSDLIGLESLLCIGNFQDSQVLPRVIQSRWRMAHLLEHRLKC